VNHSTTLAAPVAEPGTRPRSFRRIAATVATAALAGGMLVAVAAPATAAAPAATTGTVRSAALTWGFNDYSKSWGITTTGAATPVSPITAEGATYTTSSGFTLEDGTGSFNDSGIGSVDFDGSVTYSPFEAYGAQAYHSTFTFDDFELTTVSATEGTLTADVTWQKAASSLTEPKRVSLATFDITSLTTVDGVLSLTSAAPDFTGTVATGTYSAGYADAWPTSLVDALLPNVGADFPSYFYRTSTSAINNTKAPLPLTLSAELATPTVTVVSNVSSPENGLEIEVTGDGFRGVTNPRDDGIYIGLAKSGGITDYSSANTNSFLGTQWLNATVIASGAFSTTLKVKAATLDPNVSYSIYTWQSHTHSNESQDTETPVTIDYAGFVANVEVGLSLASTKSVYGKSVLATATVPGATSGDVKFYAGESVLGTAAVNDKSVATLALRSTLSAGAKVITARFVGTDTVNPATSNAVTLKVAKATTSKVSISGKAFTKKTAPKLSLTIAKLNNGTYASGSVKIYKNSKLVKTVKITTAKKGKLTITLPKSTATFKVKATFVGSANVAAKSSTTAKVSVKK